MLRASTFKKRVARGSFNPEGDVSGTISILPHTFIIHKDFNCGASNRKCLQENKMKLKFKV